MPARLKVFLPGEKTALIVTAAIIGLLAGLVIIVFRGTVALVHEQIFVRGHELLRINEGGWRRLLLPLLPMSGMLLLIPLSLLFPGKVNGYGFTKFLRKVNLEDGVIKAENIFIKIAATALTIGTGNSAGVEGPIAQIGGALGSQVGQRLRVSSSRMKVYVAAGCAAGVAGMFNAPLAGVFFAAEIILLGTYEMSSFSALVIASAMSTVVSRAWFGAAPAFPIPPYQIVNPVAELPLYTVMAVLVGAAAVLHIRFFYWLRDRFAELPLHGQLKPILGAFLVGCIGILFPQVMGDGYHFIEQVLTDKDTVLWTLAALVVLKSVATAITLGSGGAGGVFAPSLFIGAMIGGSFGSIAHTLLPHQTASPGAYATVGIGAFLAAVTHAPMTAIFLLFEMTGNYAIIVPAMLTAILGTVVAEKLHSDSIDTVDFTREGIDIHNGLEVAVLKAIKVGRAISEEVNFVTETANINQLLNLFAMTGDSFYFPVVNHAGRMVGMVSMQDVRTILHDEDLRCCHLVGGICSRDVIALTPDDNLFDAIQLFDFKGLEEIPVVESMDDKWVVGMLRRRDALALYNREVLRRGIREKAEEIRILCSSAQEGR
jgi:chloride channel protein, CIC family